MKINSELGYEPVTYSELTQDEAFWKGCKSCVNYDILTMKERKNCMCTAMLFDPAEKAKDTEKTTQGVPTKGSIGIQVHPDVAKMTIWKPGNKVQFRNIRIKPL